MNETVENLEGPRSLDPGPPSFPVSYFLFPVSFQDYIAANSPPHRSQYHSVG
jgi:hypothetical protein